MHFRDVVIVLRAILHNFPLFIILLLILFILEVDLAVWIKDTDVTLHMILLQMWHLDCALRLFALEEVMVVPRLQVPRIVDGLYTSLLICKAFIAFHHLIVLSVLVVADEHQVLGYGWHVS